ncbi:MAG: glycosyltransferase family 2 protein [Bacteroides sp.]|nr:glycosyltransferase family 2 protein [Ruminococcus flavefaciens]MCM1555527.1 glycosyltransferase family 2 protein [Bacteroides sp.]
MDLSVIIPAYNEEGTIEEVLRKISETLSDSPYSYQLIVVDDGSKDRTAELVESFIGKTELKNGMLSLIRKENGGKGSAIREGIPYATGKYTIIQDADLEYEPADIVRMMNRMTADHLDVLYGSRFLDKSNKHSYMSFYLGGRLVSLATNILYGQRLTDEPTCYKLFSTQLLKSIRLNCTGFEFCPEVTAKVAKRGYKISEIPISYRPRTVDEGKKISWKDGVEALWVLLRYRFCR